MKELSATKVASIVRHYFLSNSYDDIARLTATSKGSVVNVISALRNGRLPDLQELADQVEQLRELAVDVRKSGIVPSQAQVGLAVLLRLRELGIEPREIEAWAVICREMVADPDHARELASAAVYVQKTQQATGMNASQLQDHVKHLLEEAQRLEAQLETLRARSHEVSKSEGRLKELQRAVSEHQKRSEELAHSIAIKERREIELAQHVESLETRAHQADAKLVRSREDVSRLSGLGISADDLSKLVASIRTVASKHGLRDSDLVQRLLQELSHMDQSVGLEHLLNDAREELEDKNTLIREATQEQAALEAEVAELEDRRAQLRKMLDAEADLLGVTMAKIRKAMVRGGRLLGDRIAQSTGQAIAEIHTLKQEAVELGRQAGNLEQMLEGKRWLKVLVGIVEGTTVADAVEVRAVMVLMVMGCTRWLGGDSQAVAQVPLEVKLALGRFDEALRGWHA